MTSQSDALFNDDWQERINTFLNAWLNAWLNERQLSLILNMKTKHALVEALYTEGAFDGHSGADYTTLQVSEHGTSHVL